jgi:hypothetical protein
MNLTLIREFFTTRRLASVRYARLGKGLQTAAQKIGHLDKQKLVATGNEASQYKEVASLIELAFVAQWRREYGVERNEMSQNASQN